MNNRDKTQLMERELQSVSNLADRGTKQIWGADIDQYIGVLKTCIDRANAINESNSQYDFVHNDPAYIEMRKITDRYLDSSQLYGDDNMEMLVQAYVNYFNRSYLD